MRQRVDLRLTVPAPAGGRWFAYGDGSAEQAAQESRYSPPSEPEAAVDPWDLLPSRVQHLHDRWIELQAVVRAHVSAESFDTTDLASRWDDEPARLRVLAGLDALEQELCDALGPEWDLRISREPAVTEVRMLGEYGCTWPLWIRDGGTGREDWPMLSDRLADHLTQWAVLADPDSDRRPPPELTERVVRDLRRELGDRYLLTMVDPGA